MRVKLKLRPPALPRDERGLALVLTLMAMVVIAALISGVFVAGRLEMAGGRTAVFATQATEAAEAGLNDMLANWSVAYNSYGIYGDSAFAPVNVGPSGRYSQVLTRMSGGKYLLRVRGDFLGPAGNVIATRYLGRYLRLAIPWLDIQAAVTAQDGIKAGGNIDIVGFDGAPPNWSGCPPGVNKAGARSMAEVDAVGASSVVGAPAEIEYDSTLVDSVFTDPFNRLKPMATMTLPGGSYSGMTPTVSGSPSVCNSADPNNWGEPYAPPAGGVVTPCRGYFPIIYSPGSLVLNTGRGQGILLVAGDLNMQGNVIFDGIVIVLGSLQTAGTGNKVTGAVLTMGTQTSIVGNPDINYSSCAISRALQFSVRAEPLRERSWVQRVN
jgi:hypothetical protein